MKTRNRFFFAGSIILILTAIARTPGTFFGGTPSSGDEKKLLDLMNNLILPSPDGILWVNVILWGIFLLPTFILTVLPSMIFYSAAWFCFLMSLIFSKPKLIKQ